MKIILLFKNVLVEGLIILLILFTFLNSFLILPENSLEKGNYGNSSPQILDQAINILPDYSGNKINLRPITESIAGKFYSYEYCLKKVGSSPKILIIISETKSESNLRNSTFLISELTTST